MVKENTRSTYVCIDFSKVYRIKPNVMKTFVFL